MKQKLTERHNSAETQSDNSNDAGLAICWSEILLFPGVRAGNVAQVANFRRVR